MTDLRKAAEMALEALEEINKLSVGEKAICLPGEIDDAMEALHQALDKPEIDQQALVQMAVLAEREACAKVCEDDFGNGALNLADAIRARGEK